MSPRKRNPGPDEEAASILNRLDSRTIFANFQFIHAHRFAFAVLFQAEAFDEECAQHQLDLFSCRTLEGARGYVVFIAVKPRRPNDLFHLAVPGFRHETFERDVLSVEAGGRVGYLIVVVGPHFVLAGPHRCSFERGCRWLGPRKCDGAQDDGKNCEAPQIHAIHPIVRLMQMERPTNTASARGPRTKSNPSLREGSREAINWGSLSRPSRADRARDRGARPCPW